jgi:hypothetical protein
VCVGWCGCLCGRGVFVCVGVGMRGGGCGGGVLGQPVRNGDEGAGMRVRGRAGSLCWAGSPHGAAPPPPPLKALLLSDELKLDEVACVELLITANEQVPF